MCRAVNPKIRYVLDYEEELQTGVRMPLESKAWIDKHKGLVRTPELRQQLLKDLRPNFGAKPKVGRPRRTKKEKAPLNLKKEQEFMKAFFKVQSLLLEGKNLLEISEQTGVSYETIVQILKRDKRLKRMYKQAFLNK